MPVTPEEWDAIMRKVEEHNATQPPLSPESQAIVDRNMAFIEEREAAGRRPATAEQAEIWQAWGESELRRIDRERGNTAE